MGKTAIFGGTFNPFHIGHYEMLEALQNDPSIDKILLMPDKIPPHKACDSLADDNTRIEMCKIVAEDFSKAEVCLIEFEREGKSYTYDTILELKKKLPKTDFAFVCGGDMLVYFPHWYKSHELMALLPFIVFKRTDTDISEFEKSVNKLTDMGMRIVVKEEIISTVSSTEIRNNFKNSSHLLPQKIYDFLLERGNYVK